MTSASVTARFDPRLLQLDIECDTARDPQALPVSAAARHLPDQRSRVTETSDGEPLPTADQRNGRYEPLVFFAPLFLGGAVLLAMFFFVAPAVFLAALFLAPI